MFTFPEIHPLLNFEMIRSELSVACRGLENSLVTCEQNCRDHVGGPETQLLEEDFRELRLAVRWLKQRTASFEPSEPSRAGPVALRNEWMNLIQQVRAELTGIHSRMEALAETFNIETELAAEDSKSNCESGSDNDVKSQSSDDNNGGSNCDTLQDELCCC